MSAILKSHRLGNAFQHYFIPKSEKLLAPQNIKIELWDLATRKIQTKFHPGLFCISAIACSDDGQHFVCLGGCDAGHSEFGIYSMATFERVSGFSIEQQACNPAVSADFRYVYFGTWKGILFRYEISSGKLDKLLQVEHCSISALATNPKRRQLALVVSPKVRNGENLAEADFILLFDLVTHQTQRVEVPLSRPDRIAGVAMMNDYLSCLVDKLGLFVPGSGVQSASLYVLDLRDCRILYRKEELVLRDTYSDISAMSWSGDERLAFIGLDEVFVIDMKDAGPEKSIPFQRPSSVSFSNCGTAVAIGGDKAMLCKL